MPRPKFSSLVFVSMNYHKLYEYRAALGLPNLSMAEVSTIDIQDLNQETLVRKKLEAISKVLPQTPFFVEHTALVIDAWKGLPGGLTRHFMETVGYQGLCRMLKDYAEHERVAAVKTVIGYHYQDIEHIFVGSIIGSIAHAPQGQAGFGWDYIFIPAGSDRTYAEMSREEKNRISMRRKAALDFASYLASTFEHDSTDELPPVAMGETGPPPSPTETADRHYAIQLYNQLSAFLSDEEVRTLCFELGIDYEDLPGRGKSNKVRDLVAYLDRRRRLPDLVRRCVDHRPDVAWGQG